MTLYYRKNSIIKGGNNEINMIFSFTYFFYFLYLNVFIVIFLGGIEFLIIILIGLIINNVKNIFLTFKKTTKLCYLTYLFSNIVTKNIIKK